MRLRVALVLVFLGITASAALGQITSATFSGTIKDETGGVLPGVDVVITNVGTSLTRSVVTDANGYFTVPGLAPGTYEARASLQGFSTAVQTGIVLEVAQQAGLNLVLRLGTTEETITVTGESPLVDVRSSALSAVVDQKTIEELPLNGRNYIAMATLQPGIVPLHGEGQHVAGPARRPVEHQWHGRAVDQLPHRRRQHARVRRPRHGHGGRHHARRRDDPGVPRRHQRVLSRLWTRDGRRGQHCDQIGDQRPARLGLRVSSATARWTPATTSMWASRRRSRAINSAGRASRWVAVLPGGRAAAQPGLGQHRLSNLRGRSTYHALQAGLIKRFSDGYQVQLSYTLSRAMDNSDGQLSTDTLSSSVFPPNPYDPDAEWAVAAFDAPHVFSANATWELPVFRGNPVLSGWQLNGILSLHTAYPFSPSIQRSTGRAAATSRPTPKIGPT